MHEGLREDRLEYLTKKWNERRPDLDITPWQVWGRITRIHELFLAAIAPALASHELNFKEFQTLAALVLRGEPYEATPQQIGRFNLLTSGGVANLLARMEREALVERRPDPDDRRSVIVRATARGLDDFEAAVIEENRVEHELLRALTREERQILGTLLRKLLLAIDPIGLG
jgi:DNA-binding MarR family transcriptional regulator